MPESRAKLQQRVAALIGSNRVTVTSPGRGWPSQWDVNISNGVQPVAAHVGPIGGSQRGRDDVERRFQNPGQNVPVTQPTGYQPLILGLWEEEGGRDVLVACDALHRLGRRTRFSIFVPLTLLRKAREAGWAEQDNSDGERLTAFYPELLPLFLEAQVAGLSLEPREVGTLLEASGVTGAADDPAPERARRAVTQLIRDSRFGKAVVAAYDARCAMCDFNFSLVQGAHIYPASASGSHDQVWNGLALCHNHHAAYDRHLIWINPSTREIAWHPQLRAEADSSSSCRSFIDCTFTTLKSPRSPNDRPKEEVFAQRYTHFAGQYKWAE